MSEYFHCEFSVVLSWDFTWLYKIPIKSGLWVRYDKSDPFNNILFTKRDQVGLKPKYLDVWNIHNVIYTNHLIQDSKYAMILDTE